MARSIRGRLVLSDPVPMLPGTMRLSNAVGASTMAALSGQSLSGPNSYKKLCDFFFLKITHKEQTIYMTQTQIDADASIGSNVFPGRKWCMFGTGCICSHSLTDEQKKHAKDFMLEYNSYACRCGKYGLTPSLCDFLGVKLDKCGFLSSSQNNHNTEPDDGQMCKFFFKEIVYPVPSKEWEERRVYITREECIQFCHYEPSQPCKFGKNCRKQHERTDAQKKAAKELCELMRKSFCTP